ncbi:pro-MCH [Betta splendens]|uniref:Pro-MCH n=1 Tax=Betta splendens TaxID=158456 RepID=A0A9W2Y2I3_BETSP|nr:pro-MCH [Betta splendens]
MISIYSLLLTVMLFSELSSHLVTVAMPATKTDNILTEQDAVGSILVDEPMSELVVVPERQRFMLDSVRDEDGNPKFIVSDMRLKGHSVRGLNSAIARRIPLLTGPSLSHAPSEYKVDRRDVDLDMLRCMVGRVYRPCWEV